jgi:ankyrin repeat protein
MNTYLKLSSVKNDNNCNCISPFYIDSLTGINPTTSRNYTPEDKDTIKTALYRISNAKGCNVNVCCDPNDPTSSPDAAFTKKFKEKFPMIMPIYTGSTLTSIKLSTTTNVKESGWSAPSTYMICKITKATIVDTADPTIKVATKLVTDCFTDQCNQAETLTLNNLMQNANTDMTNYTYIDDARVSQAIRENNITYVKEYIRTYGTVDAPLTNDSYNNRMIHIASESSGKNSNNSNANSNEILNMLIALNANINITNKLKETPLHFAVRSKNLNNIDSLLTQGVDLTLENNKGETPMFYAVATGNLRIIKMLYNSGSSILGIDKLGNNLINYCIKNSPSYKEDDTTVLNSKSEIIRFLIDHGISTEQKNIEGITPLELVSKQINREINKECALGISAQNADINEKFFNVKPFREAFTNNTNPITNPTTNPTTNKVALANKSKGAIKQNLTGDTTEHQSLLEIQSMLFNNIIRNNPNTYNGYISVDAIPKGSPIEILDTVCVGDNMTGNEDSDECISKGGQLVKVKNKTTKIKLELLPEDNTVIDAVDEKELYYKKVNDKIPDGTIPSVIKNYNSSLNNNSSNTQISVPQTTGITYTIGATSSNDISESQSQDSTSFNPQPTKKINIPISDGVSNVIPLVINGNTTSSSKSSSDLHPSIFDEDVVQKCTTDAIRNSTKITEALTTLANTTPQTTFIDAITSADTSSYGVSNTTIIIGSITLIVFLLIIGYLIAKYYSSSSIAV